MSNSDNFKSNEKELMEFYGYKGISGRIKLESNF